MIYKIINSYLNKRSNGLVPLTAFGDLLNGAKVNQTNNMFGDNIIEIIFQNGVRVAIIYTGKDTEHKGAYSRLNESGLPETVEIQIENKKGGYITKEYIHTFDKSCEKRGYCFCDDALPHRTPQEMFEILRWAKSYKC